MDAAGGVRIVSASAERRRRREWRLGGAGAAGVVAAGTATDRWVIVGKEAVCALAMNAFAGRHLKAKTGVDHMRWH